MMCDAIRVDGLDQLVRTLSTAFPSQVQKAARLACSDAARSAKSEGNRVAREEYTSKRVGRQMQADVKRGPMEAVVTFRGGRGQKPMAFIVKPGFGKRPRGGLSVQVRRAGGTRPIIGPNGEKAFWIRGKNGNKVIVYRPGKSRYVTNENLLFASPIQAVGKKKNMERIATHAGEKARERLWHQLGRVCKGDIR